MGLLITWREDQCDGTTLVRYRTPGGHDARVVVGLDKIADGTVYEIMAADAERVDAEHAALATGRLHSEDTP